MSEVILSKDNFEEEVLKCDKKVLVDFWAKWCGPCQMLGPVISQIAEEREDIKVGKVNVDDNEELSRMYGVMTIPMLAVFSNGEVIKTSVGYKSYEDILEMLEV